jgi:hypothetical protein
MPLLETAGLTEGPVFPLPRPAGSAPGASAIPIRRATGWPEPRPPEREHHRSLAELAKAMQLADIDRFMLFDGSRHDDIPRPICCGYA